MRKILLITLCFLSQWAVAQKETPKWVEKAKRAVFSIVTYDKDDKLLNTGNGFFVSEDGVALSDYTLFKGAQRASIVNFEGKQMPVEAIIGVNDLYDVIKFRVAIEKKVPALQIATVPPAKDAVAYLLPYSTQKDRSCTEGKVTDISSLPGGHHYYTLSMALTDKMVSCPVTDAEGLVFGLAQKDAAGDGKQCYAVGANFAMSLALNAISIHDSALESIGIKKALPQTEEQALVYLMMNANKSPEDYLALINEFIAQFPNSSEGYLRRATHYVYNFRDDRHFGLAEADLAQAMKLSQKKDDIHFNTAKLVYANQLIQPEFKYKDWGYEKALQQIQQAISIDPLPLYIQQEGDIYFAMQNYPKAYEAYDKVNKSALASAATFYSAAKTKELMNADWGEVIALLDSAVAKYTAPLPEEAGAYVLERAQAKMNKEMYRQAAQDYDTYYYAVGGKVNDLFYYLREQAHYKAKNFKGALDDIDKAVEMNPKDATYLAEQGAVNLRIARYDEAIKALEAALVIDPKFAACYRLIGFCQLQQGKKNEACENFAKAKELGDEAVNSLIEKNCK